MRRTSRHLVFAVMLAVLAASTVATAQPSTKSYRIGWLGHGSPQRDWDRTPGDFPDALRDAGYVEGKNVAIVYRYGSGKVDRLTELASELIRVPVDVIVTTGEPAALAAKRATNTIPIVVTELAMDPVKAGLVASLGRPGGNVTGMATQSEELWQKRLALLKQVAPKVSRAAVLWNPANPGNAHCVEEIKGAASAMGMQTRFLEAGDVGALERAFDAITREPTDALVTCWDSMTLAQAQSIAEFALRQRLPTLAPLKEYVEAGGLLSLGTSLAVQRRRAAYYVGRILKGAKPSDLPIERPTQFDLVVNVSTANSLGIALPDALLLLADEVIR